MGCLGIRSEKTPGEYLEMIKTAQENKTNCIAIKNFDFEYYNTLTEEQKNRILKIIKTGLENPDSNMGMYAMNPDDYDLFKPFFKKCIAEYHKVPEDSVQVNNWNFESSEEGGKLDLKALGFENEISMRVRVGRNLEDFPLPGAMTKEDRCKLENKMCEAFKVLISNPDFGGKYNSLTPGHVDFIDNAKYKSLVDSHQMFKDMSADPYLNSAGISSDWPYGRGCYISEDNSFIIWVGEEDHLRIMCMKKGFILNEVFDRLKKSLDEINKIEGLKFALSKDYGVITSCPTNLGTGMRASVHVPLPNLTEGGSDVKAKEICKPLGLSVRGLGGEHTPIGEGGVCDISPSARFCISEGEIIGKLYSGIKLLMEEENKLKK